MGNPVTHWQIVSKDPEGAAGFYQALFGWKVDSANGLNYRMVDTQSGGRGVPGGIWPSPPEGHTLVQLFVEVDDVEAATRKATDLGAALVMPKQVLPDGDEMAIIHDRFGITFGLWRKGKSADPASS